MGAAMLLMMAVLMFAVPTHGFHGMSPHDSPPEQMRGQAAAAPVDSDHGRRATEGERDLPLRPAGRVNHDAAD